MDHIYHKIQGAFTFPQLYYSAVSHFNNAEFIEIGCDRGQSLSFLGVEIINKNKNIKIHAVDTWGDNINSWNSSDTVYTTFLNNIKPVQDILKDKINIIRSYSVEAASKFNDQSLDFIFIDACHEYECVIADLNAWFPKLKPNGWIAGHDYYAGHYGVESAVNEFFYDKYPVNFQEFCWLVRV